MASTPGDNVAKLQEAGLITKTSLPDEYREVVEGMKEDEVNLLVSLKERVDRAEESHMSAAGDDAVSASECFVPL